MRLDLFLIMRRISSILRCASSFPFSIRKSTCSKSLQLTFPIGGVSTKSAFLSARRFILALAAAFARIIISTTFVTSSGSNVAETFEAITISAPISRAVSIGKLLITEPSTSWWPLNGTGGKNPGIAAEALMAWCISPVWKTTSCPEVISTAEQAKGMAVSSISPGSIKFSTDTFKRSDLSKLLRCAARLITTRRLISRLNCCRRSSGSYLFPLRNRVPPSALKFSLARNSRYLFSTKSASGCCA